MAITMISPTTGSVFYGSDSGLATNTISYSSTTANQVTIQYSKDAGNTWSTIQTNVASSIGTNNYSWVLDGTEMSDILPSGTNIDDDVIIRVTDQVTAESDMSDVFTVARVSFQGIVPNSSNNTLPIFYHAESYIRWDEIYDSGIANVKIEIYNGTVWQTLVNSTPNTGYFKWKPSNSNVATPPGLSFTDVTNGRVRISAADVGHTSNIEVSDTTGGFTITDTANDASIASGISSWETEYPARYETGARVGGEKAIFMDEMTPLGQWEAGSGIEILQRSISGTHPDLPAPTDPDRQAYNIVIRATGSRAPRSFKDIVQPNAIDTTHETVDGFYGTRYYIDVVHGWDLGNASDPNYIAGQTPTSLMVQIRNITSAVDTTTPSNYAEATWEVTNSNTIRVYHVRKGSAYVTNETKDQIPDVAASPQWFEVKIIEVLD